MDNLAVRQCLSEFFYAFVGELVSADVAEVDIYKVAQAFQVHQAGVGDLGVGEEEPLQVGQSFQMHQAGVGDPIVAEAYGSSQ